MSDQSKGWRGADPDAEVELVEVVPVDESARRRRLVVGVGALVVLTGVIAWAVVAGVGGPEDTSLTRVAGAEVATDGDSTTTTQTTVAVTDALSADSSVFGAPTTSPPGPTTPSDSVISNYSEFVDALQRNDQAAVDAYCAAHPPAAWHVPNFVGRSSSSPLTSSERSAAVLVTGCYHLTDGMMLVNSNIIVSVRVECTTDSAQHNRIFWQEDAPGSVYTTPNHLLRVAAYKYCGDVPTTEPDSPPPPTLATTTTPEPPPPVTTP